MITTVHAAAPNKEGGKPQSGMGSFLPMMLIMFIIIYFFMIRPQSRKQKEMKRMLDAVKKGDKVVTAGGIIGTVSQVKENSVIIKVDSDTRIEFRKSAIASVINQTPAEEGK